MKSYLIFLSRNKLYTAIQAIGLSLALGFVILLASYAKTEFGVGKGHAFSEQTYVIGRGDRLGMTFGTAESFFPNVPEIRDWTRIHTGKQLDLFSDGLYYKATSIAVDTNFFEFFDYRAEGTGTRPVLASSTDILLSQSFAQKVFGTVSPVGRQLSDSDGGIYTVIGIIEDFGPKEVLKSVDVVVSTRKIADEIGNNMNLQFGPTQTLVKLVEGAQPEAVAEKLLKEYCATWNFYKPDDSYNAFVYGSTLTRWDEVYFSECNVESTAFRKGNRLQVEILFTVALVLLISAVINFINLTVALTGKRAHEMATRRLMGDTKEKIIWRYLRESLLFTFSCGLIALPVALLLRPYFEQLLSAKIVMDFDAIYIGGILVLLFIIALISGLIPAVIMSRFQPLDIVKGNFRYRNKQVFSRIFIIVQHVISAVLLAVGLTMAMQLYHLLHMPKGYNAEGIVFVWAWDLGSNPSNQKVLHERLAALPCVESASTAANLPHSCNYNGIKFTDDQDKLYWLAQSALDTAAFHQFRFEVLERYSEPLPHTIWISESSKEAFGVTAEKPYVQDKRTMSKPLKVCGIVKDFLIRSPLEAPMENSYHIIENLPADNSNTTHILKVNGEEAEVLNAIREVCSTTCKQFTGVPNDMNPRFVEEDLRATLSAEQNTMTLVLSFMVVSLLLTALGLLAMSVSYTEQQSRRAALCKVMGASSNRVTWELSRHFLLLSFISTLISLPLSIKIIRHYLEGFYYRIDFPWWIVALSVVAILCLSLFSIYGQTRKVAHRNPIESLKNE